MKVLYINLDKDIERREFMEEQLTRLGFEYERVSAVDGRALSEAELAEVYDSESSIKYNKKDLTRGELGCALSHKRCHEIALGHDYTLIIEDDIELPKNFKEIVEKQIAKNIDKKNWDYLQFDYPSTGIIFIKRWFGSTSLYMKTHLKEALFCKKLIYTLYSAIKFIYIAPLSLLESLRDRTYKSLNTHRAVRFYRPLYFAGCYIVSTKGAKKLLNLQEKIIYVADRIQNQARITKSLKFKAFSPLVVKQKREEFGSSVIGISSVK